MLVDTGFVDIEISQPMTPSVKLEVKRKPGSSMFMDTRSSLVSPASILPGSPVA